MYHFKKVQYDTDQLEEVCINVFVSRQNPQISSIFWIWKSVDVQERESYDMLGITHESHLLSNMECSRPVKIHHNVKVEPTQQGRFTNRQGDDYVQ